MSDTEQPDRINLTDEQKQEVKDAAAGESSALDAPVEELEQRIAPTETVSLNFTKVSWKY